jgi:hypothetical protein
MLETSGVIAEGLGFITEVQDSRARNLTRLYAALCGIIIVMLLSG